MVQDDLDAAVAPGTMSSTAPRGPRADVVEDIKIIGLRRKIAEKMQEAKRRIPHFTFIDEVDMTEVEDLRAHLNQDQARRDAQADGAAVPRPRDRPCDRRFSADECAVRRRGRRDPSSCRSPYGHRHTDGDGLMVPVVRHAESLDIWQCAVEIARVAAAARDNKAKSEELSGSTITITSLGTLGGVAATPVINHPEVAIIGPNAIVERPVVRDGRIAVRRMMNLSSSFDHRVVDGYDAAAFIRRIRTLLEHPATLSWVERKANRCSCLRRMPVRISPAVAAALRAPAERGRRRPLPNGPLPQAGGTVRRRLSISHLARSAV